MRERRFGGNSAAIMEEEVIKAFEDFQIILESGSSLLDRRESLCL